MSSSSWSAERINALRQLWLAGHSASQIAQALGGVTRNAVIGKVHRLGLGQRMAPSAPRRVRGSADPGHPPRRSPSRPPPPPAAPAVARVRPPAALVVEAVARLFDAAELSARVCRWPIGDPRLAGFGYCGAPAPGKGPYCPDHHRVAYRARAPVKAVPARRARPARLAGAG